MAEEVANLVLEHLKQFQAGQDRIEKKLGEVVTRLASLERHMALVHDDVAGLNLRMDEFSTRVDRIERRLEIVNAP